ncbi:MAG: DUF4954 family protein, partial [Chitinophagaceae bacterium]|nr:DUF4954 family protein [Chitinophagaceae bacterium]
DGEIIAGRGFLPGLCVSLKHNSQFAAFTIIAKGDFPAELNIPVPFSLVSNDVTNDMLVVMPGYWFMYNMYALARNSWKYTDRDKRTEKKQLIEHDFLAPDTINEIIQALQLFKKFTGEAWILNNPGTAGDAVSVGEKLLETNDAALNGMDIFASGFENTGRKTKLIKVPACYSVFKKLISYYAARLLVNFIESQNITSVKQLQSLLPASTDVFEWKNIGGQLITAEAIGEMEKNIKSGKIDTWEEVHAVYAKQGDNYEYDKLQHALAAVKLVNGFSSDDSVELKSLLDKSVETKKWMVDNIYSSREKDYTNPFRMMVYENREEMDKVVGRLEDNQFIKQEKQAFEEYRLKVKKILGMMNN